MIHSKNHKLGMSFIEVLVALMLVSVVIMATFKTQMVMQRSAVKTATQLQVVAAIDAYFMQATRDKFLEKDAQQEKEIENSPIKLVYKATSAKDSSVFKNITGIMVEKITATWSQLGREQTMSMVRFTHKQPENKEEKAKGKKP